MSSPVTVRPAHAMVCVAVSHYMDYSNYSSLLIIVFITINGGCGGGGGLGEAREGGEAGDPATRSLGLYLSPDLSFCASESQL